MGKNLKWPIEALQKKGLIEVDGKYIPVARVTSFGRVDKLPGLGVDPEPELPPIAIKKFIKEGFSKINLENKIPVNYQDQLFLSTGDIPKMTVEELHKAFNETGFLITKPVTERYWQLPDGEHLSIKYMFNIDPVAAPRMTKRDQWRVDPNHPDPNKRQRRPVTKYFAFKNKLQYQCAVNGYELTGVLNILFVIPMPKSWSKKKQAEMRFQSHQQRPDRDNYLKAVQDSFKCDDGFVWDGRTIKVWGYLGEIIIF